MRRSVDLPQPDVPTMQTNSFSSTSSEQSLSAVTSAFFVWNTFSTWLAVMMLVATFASRTSLRSPCGDAFFFNAIPSILPSVSAPLHEHVFALLPGAHAHGVFDRQDKQLPVAGASVGIGRKHRFD